MFIIFTVSSISVVPTIYFSFAGISCAYFLSQQQLNIKARSALAKKVLANSR
jgi:hypothetical protein